MATGPTNIAAVQASFKELYDETITELFSVRMNAWQILEENADVKKAPNQRNLVLLKKTKRGGYLGSFNPNSGDLGRGSGPQYANATITTIPIRVALESTRAADWFTQPGLAIGGTSRLLNLLEDGTETYKEQMVRYMWQDGSGKCFTLASGQGTSTYTATNALGARQALRGQKYEQWDSTIATYRGQVTVDDTDITNKRLTLTVPGPAGGAAGDVLIPEGLVTASPTWIQGFDYHISSSTTRSWMGMSAATLPQIRSIEITASGSISPVYLRNLKGQMEDKRPGITKTGTWGWVFPNAQMQAYEQLGLQLDRRERQGTDRPGLDVLYNLEEFRVDGDPVVADPYCNPGQVYFLDWSAFFRAETVKFGLYTVDDISTWPIYGASGGISTSEGVWLAGMLQMGCYDPMRGARINSLTIPANY